MRHRRLAGTRIRAILCAVAGSVLVLVAAPAAASNGATSGSPMPDLPYNACNNTSLPTDYGTNFPTPNDPYGFGYYNQTAIGWEGNWYAPFAYLSGSYFARGVPTTYTDSGGTQYCGAMYSFGVYTYGLKTGQAPPAQSETWTEADGYLPALTTSFTSELTRVSCTPSFLGRKAACLPGTIRTRRRRRSGWSGSMPGITRRSTRRSRLWRGGWG
jgi:hypothetical protein